MEATLKFNLEDQEDIKNHLRCIKSLDMTSALFEIQINLKKKLTRALDAEEATDAEYTLLEKVFNHIDRELEDRGVNIDELTS